MKSLFLRATRAVAIIAGCAAVLPAADQGFGAELRMRGGIELASNKDHLSRHMITFGLAGTYGFEFGTLFAEAGYQYKPGTQWLEPFLPAATGMPEADPANSADSRKNSLEGLSLRLGFERELPWKHFSWQAGLAIANAKFRHEYIADIGDTGWANYEDTYNGTPTKSMIAVNPFLGIRYKVGEVSTFELNVISVAYKSINFHHTPGAALVSGSTSQPGSVLVYDGDGLTEKNRRALHLEFGYSFRF